MKNIKKIVGVLAIGVLLVGCSSKDIEARPSDYKDTLGDVDLKKVYDAALTSQGYGAMADELLFQFAELEHNAAKTPDTTLHSAGIEEYDYIQKHIYEKINDKITTFQKDASYIEYNEYEKNSPITETFADGKDREYGTFLEEKAVKKLRADGETIELPGETLYSKGTHADLWDAETVFGSSTIVNTYITKTLYRQVMKDYLNEDYIVEYKSSYYSTTQFRRIEYVHVDFDSEKQTESTEKLLKYENALLNGEEVIAGQGTTKILKQIEEDWQAFKVAKVEDEISKIGGADDIDGKYTNKYHDGNHPDAISENIAKKNADEEEFYKETEIYTNTSTIVNSSITSRIFSSTILSAQNEKLYLKEDLKNLTDNEGTPVTNNYYFLKTFVAEPLPDEHESIIQDESGTYYFIRIQFVNKDIDTAFINSSDAEDLKLKYDIAEQLTQKASNLAGNILYYLNKYKVSLHDDEFAKYLKDNYSYPKED